MAKRRKGVDNDPRQMSLLDILQQSQQLREQSTAGSLCIQPRLSLCMGRLVRKCELEAWEIAGRMSELTGDTITEPMLRSWTAESKKLHRPPAEYIPAFCMVVGSNEPMQILNDATGLFSLPGPDAIRAELQKLREKGREVNSEIRKRELFLKEMEG